MKRTWQDKIEIESKQLGQKDKIITIKKDSSGIHGIEVMNNDQQNLFCLNDEQIIKLGKVGVIIEKLFNGPRDVEWTFYKVQCKCKIIMKKIN